MIFDGKPIDEITDEEIRALVSGHFVEQRHLEFKVTVDHRDDDDRLETLLDISSIANGGGGYVFVGVRDDGRGRAQVFENPGDTARIARSLRDLCLEQIEPRIDGLEIRERIVDGHPLVIVRVPVSGRTPHMATYQEGTHFWSRYEDGKRAMTYAEIHTAFTEDLLNRRLSVIEGAIGGLAQAGAGPARRQELLGLIRAGEPLARLAARSGEELSQADAEAFRATIGERHGFYLSATPEPLNRRAVDVDQDEIRMLFRQTPDSRPTGWIVTSRFADIERFADGIRYRGHTLETGVLELLTNGHLSYGCVLREPFYWKQPPEEAARRPRLWPFAVIEYPVSFLKLFRAIADLSRLEQPFHIRLAFYNIRGHLLPPGPPTDFGFIRGHEAVPYPHENLILPPLSVARVVPDALAYALLRDVYAAFGYGPDSIPFWDGENQRFAFPSV
jgi:hypothetical protein